MVFQALAQNLVARGGIAIIGIAPISLQPSVLIQFVKPVRLRPGADVNLSQRGSQMVIPRATEQAVALKAVKTTVAAQLMDGSHKVESITSRLSAKRHTTFRQQGAHFGKTGRL